MEEYILTFAESLIFKTLLQVSLLGVFFYNFGYPSLLKYQENKTIELSSEKKTMGIPAPDVTICAKSRGKEKFKTNTSFASVIDSCDQYTNDFECITEHLLGFNDVILDARKGMGLHG